MCYMKLEIFTVVNGIFPNLYRSFNFVMPVGNSECQIMKVLFAMAFLCLQLIKN